MTARVFPTRIAMTALALVALLLISSGSAAGQTPEKGPVTDSFRFWYFDYAKKNLLASAELMPEKDFAFRPTPDVRTFGEVLDHVAQTQQLFCSTLKGEERPAPPEGNGDPKRTKAQVLAALREAFAACDDVFAKATDADLGTKVKLLGRERAKTAVMTLSVVHMGEHYGNVVTYLRLKGLVPPSSK